MSENDIQKPSLLSLTRDECEKCQNQLEEWNEAPPEGVEVKIQNIDKLKITKPGLLELFQITYDHFFDIFSRAIPTPVSFLIDTNGNLRSIYRGQIRPETLSKDIQMIESGGYDGRNLSLPFPGIWSSESNPSARPLNFVEDLVDAGKISMAEKYISDERETLIKDDVFPMLLKRIESIKKERRP